MPGFGTNGASVGVSRSEDARRAETLGIYRQRETKTNKTPNQLNKIERKKDLREYTEEEKQAWKKAKQQENSEKAAIARKWIAEDIGKNKRLPAICQCGRAVKGESSSVYITEEAHIYNDHIQCRSWSCPICAYKRSWARTLELEQALIAAAKKDYKQLFITFTIPHTKQQKTKTVLNHLNAAYHSFRNDRKVKKCLSSLGFVGQIKSLDFTFTENGVHAHFHTVWIFDSPLFVEQVAAECYSVMLEAWNEAVKKETGRSISRKHGFDIERIEIPDDGSEQAEAIALYTAKVISIYAASADKDKGSLTPFDLLDLDREEEYKPIYLDYYKGSKGVRRIIFSRGLKEKLGVIPTEFEKPQQVSIATISPEHTDFLRSERNRQHFEELITSNRAAEALKWLDDSTRTLRHERYKSEFIEYLAELLERVLLPDKMSDDLSPLVIPRSPGDMEISKNTRLITALDFDRSLFEDNTEQIARIVNEEKHRQCLIPH